MVLLVSLDFFVFLRDAWINAKISLLIIAFFLEVKTRMHLKGGRSRQLQVHMIAREKFIVQWVAMFTTELKSDYATPVQILFMCVCA